MAEEKALLELVPFKPVPQEHCRHPEEQRKKVAWLFAGVMAETCQLCCKRLSERPLTDEEIDNY